MIYIIIIDIIKNGVYMQGKGYIVWYADVDKLDLKDPWVKKWWIQQVLINGRFEDISLLDFDVVKGVLPSLYLNKKIKSLWEDYFRHTR